MSIYNFLHWKSKSKLVLIFLFILTIILRIQKYINIKTFLYTFTNFTAFIQQMQATIDSCNENSRIHTCLN